MDVFRQEASAEKVANRWQVRQRQAPVAANHAKLLIMDYEYFEYDNAHYRKRADSGLSAVDDVWFPSVGWTPYKGDKGKPFLEGIRVPESEVPPFRKPAVEELARQIEERDRASGKPAPVEPEKPPPDPSGPIERTGVGSRAFQIIGAPPKSKPR
jgi:hypothetical protein